MLNGCWLLNAVRVGTEAVDLGVSVYVLMLAKDAAEFAG